jgi:hypothetical protein
MAAITPSTDGTPGRGHSLVRFYGTGTANQADTFTTTAVPKGGNYRLAYVTCAYSNTPTQAGVSIGIDSGLGAGYDSTLTTGSANARYTNYVPDEDIFLFPSDSIIVTAPAGGSGLTASIVVVFETS